MGNTAQEKTIALPSSCKWSLTCSEADTSITFSNILSPSMTFFLEIYLCDFSFCFFSTTFNHPTVASFKEHFEIQQIIPNWNVQPWSCTLSGWCFVSSYWFFPIRISTFAFLTHIFKSSLLFAKDTAISLVPQAHVNGITVQSYLPLDLISNSSPSISKCLTLFEAPITSYPYSWDDLPSLASL